jgi:uncharacterized protein (TIGR03083 family)
VPDVDPMMLARAERTDLAAFLEKLTPAEWEARSLCAGWRVRDLVAHVYSCEGVGAFGMVRRLVAGRLRLDRINELGRAALATATPDDLVELAQRSIQPRGLTAAFHGRIALVDALIHQQDIRRPLDLPREIPADRLRCALDFARTAPPIGARSRIRGLTLTATDVDWATGYGPLVEGTGEALLMAMAGRAAVLPELTGPGATVLGARIAARSSLVGPATW